MSDARNPAIESTSGCLRPKNLPNAYLRGKNLSVSEVHYAKGDGGGSMSLSESSRTRRLEEMISKLEPDGRKVSRAGRPRVNSTQAQGVEKYSVDSEPTFYSSDCEKTLV